MIKFFRYLRQSSIMETDYNKLKADAYFKTSLKINIGNAESTIKMLKYGLKNIRILIPIINNYTGQSNN